jgi:hypothetical protein
MTLLIWRQHRNPAAVTAIALAVLAQAVVPVEVIDDVTIHATLDAAFGPGLDGLFDLLRQTDVEVQPQRRSYLVVQESSETAVPRINTTQQFTFVESHADGVISLSRARFPSRELTGHNNRQSIKICDDLPVDWLV